MRGLRMMFLCLALTLAVAHCSLLEMSQTLWNKLLEGGLTKVGYLDPLRVPVVKVDQSEGDTSYRMVLRNVEITGLNDSTLESIHVARGRLVSNLSELESGYVSYSDLRDLDSIRYRFHTVLNDPKPENVASAASNQEVRFQRISNPPGNQQHFQQNHQQDRYRDSRPVQDRYQDSRQAQYRYDSNHQDSQQRRQEQRGRYDEREQGHREHYDPRDDSHPHRDYDHRDRGQESRRDSASSRSQQDRQREYYREETRSQHASRPEFVASVNPSGGSFQMRGSKFQADVGRTQEGSRYPPGVQVIYAQTAVAGTKNIPNEGDVVNCPGNCRRAQSGSIRTSTRPPQRRFREDQVESFDIRGSASERFETRAQDPRMFTSARSGGRRTGEAPSRDSISSFNSKADSEAGFMDIVYTDKSNKTVKHFGNLRMYDMQEARVYNLDDIMKDIRENRRFIIHNFTEGESLKKRNDALRTATETKRIKDMIRYAKDHQEKEGYFEEGMELIYHYGGMGDKSSQDPRIETRRPKRAHTAVDQSDDDIMHVILKIRVPLLRIKAEYQLSGKVGKEIVRGNGMLMGNFTELMGDFTIELKKVGENSMIVRAARAKLQAKDKKITLQGMNEKGPVQSILNYGLMAAEAVAAMLADDLATKALSERTADAMIYRMYKNLPPN